MPESMFMFLRFMTLKRLSRLSGGHLGPCAAGGRLVSDTAPIKIVTAQPDKVDDCARSG